jgi:RNA polymerase sigma-70 factor (ECF subfamily)
MDKPNRSTERARPLSQTTAAPTPWYDATIAQAFAIARAAAGKAHRPDVADDIAQDVVLSLLEKFASGRVTEPPTYLEALVRRMVRNLATDRNRRDRARTVREAYYSANLSGAAPSWMVPDAFVEARELDDIRLHVLAELPPTCREVFVLVREGQMSYKAVGERLDLTPRAICAHVVTAQRLFRERLQEQGIAISRPQRRRRRRGRRNRKSGPPVTAG